MPPQKGAEADEIPPEIDEGPRPGPVDEIQAALFEAAQANVSTDVDFETLARPAPGIAKGPRPEPVDEIQAALQEAAQANIATDVDFEALAKPAPVVDRAPQDPVDEVQAALLEASKASLAPNLDFEALPAPTAAPPKKGVKSRSASRPVLRVDQSALPEAELQPASEFMGPVSAVSEFGLILALFITFRLLTLFLLRPGGFIRDWSDFDTFFGIATLSDYGLYPFLDFWLEWPPLIPWLAVGAYRLALFLPPWPDDPRLWFILIFGGVFVLFEIGNFFLIYRLAKRIMPTPERVSRVLWLYTGLFPPVYAMLGFFDGVALFFMLLALELILEDRRFLSAIVVGIGFMVKIVPVLMLPVVLRRLWHQYRANTREAQIEAGLYAVIMGLTVILLLAPFLIWGPEWVLASARALLDRSPWETVWAVIEGYYGFGVVEGNRLNPEETNFATYEGWLPWWLIMLVFLGLYGYLFSRPADYDYPSQLIALGGLTVTLFLIFSKGYSPQFLVYLLPFVLLLMPDGRGVTYALILTFLNVLEQPIYFVLLPDERWLLTFTVIARLIVMLILALEFALVLWPVGLASLAQVRQRAPVALGGLAALALIILTPVSLRAYSDSQLTNSPVGSFAGFMETQLQAGNDKPRLLLSDQDTYQQIYPYLHETFDLQLSNGATRFPETEALSISDLLQGVNEVWILPTGPQEAALQNVVSGRGEALGSYNFEGLGTASLYSFQSNPLPRPPLARFTGGIELLAHEVEKSSGGLEVTLYWRARNPQNQERLTVFTQLLNEAGEWAAGHDAVPRNGTAPVTGWAVDTVQADSHLIPISAELPPGNYTVIAGLRVNQERLVSLAPDGSNYPDAVVPLEIISLP